MKHRFRFLSAAAAALGCLLPAAPTGAAPPPPPQGTVPYAHGVLTPEQEAAVRQALSLSPDRPIRLEVVTKTGGSTTVKERGRGIGAGATAEGANLSDAFTGSPPNVNMDGKSAQGGGVQREASGDTTEGKPAPWANPLFWAGLACLGGVGALFYFRIPGPKILLAAAGAGLLSIAFFPSLIIWIFLAIVAVLVYPSIMEAREAEKERARADQNEAAAVDYQEALRAVVAGIEDSGLSPEARAAVKDRIAQHADDRDRVTIRTIKQMDKLGAFA